MDALNKWLESSSGRIHLCWMTARRRPWSSKQSSEKLVEFHERVELWSGVWRAWQVPVGAHWHGCSLLGLLVRLGTRQAASPILSPRLGTCRSSMLTEYPAHLPALCTAALHLNCSVCLQRGLYRQRARPSLVRSRVSFRSCAVTG